MPAHRLAVAAADLKGRALIESDQLLEHLAAIEGIPVPDQGVIAVLARAGAQLLVSGIELDGAYDAAQ
jgi:nitrogen fixation protein FixH